uniref:Cyclin-dependent kinase inhibitor 2C (p18, inhibits CDK4) n=1 Tax=Cynoglossus semilaevis TaxID=244447 RepID=A0A3P8X327_CYNSE
MDDQTMADKLCTASACGHLDKVLFLLQSGADVSGINKYGRTALQVVKLSCPDLVKVLLNKGANPDLRDPVLGLTVTHDAAREGFDDTVSVLLQHGANPNLLDDRGNLPLHLAAKEGNLEVVRLLLGFTENPSATNAQGRTARQLAQDHGKTQTAELIDEYLNNAPRHFITGRHSCSPCSHVRQLVNNTL